ncbi:MAG TPA: hypothetical protein VII57_06225 [Dehalococcoidia bacterium]
MALKPYQTAMAAEYFVMSALYRLGLDASLTLGNRKQIDIVVERPGRIPITIDVKGVYGKGPWLLTEADPAPGHFLVFVSFEGTAAASTSPTSFIIPAQELTQFLKPITKWSTGKTKYSDVSYARIRDSNYREAWHLIRDAVGDPS